MPSRFPSAGNITPSPTAASAHSKPSTAFGCWPRQRNFTALRRTAPSSTTPFMSRPANPLPSADELNRVFRYDANADELYWRIVPEVPARVRGKRALTAKSGSGYLFGSFRGQHMQRHRVIWKLATGLEPLEIDHIDGDRTNNRVSNLRSVTHVENCRARGRYATNTSGITGVSWNARENKWLAYIHVDGRMKNLGLFGSKEAAATARAIAENIQGYNVRA